MSWFATLPIECIPPSRASASDCVVLAQRLDASIDAIMGNRPAADAPRQPVPESGIQQLVDGSAMPDSNPVSQMNTPDSSMAPSGTALPSMQSETAPDDTPFIETEVKGKGGALARVLHGQLSVSPGKSEQESSHEQSEPEHVSGPMAGVMARWNQKRSRR